MSGADNNSLPVWLNVTVVLTLLALLCYNIVLNGPDGVPTSYILGGLLGGYIGVERLVRRGGDKQ